MDNFNHMDNIWFVHPVLAGRDLFLRTSRPVFQGVQIERWVASRMKRTISITRSLSV